MLAVTGTAVIVGAAFAAPAGADPDTPSAHDVAKAKRHAHERAEQVGSVKAKLAHADSRLQELNATVESLVRKYQDEQADLRQAKEAYRSARERVRRAELGVDHARAGVGHLAAQAYRTGGAVSGVASLFGADGPKGVVDQMNTLRMLGRERSAVLAHVRASRIVAGVMREQAHHAFAKQRAATRRVAAAKKAAQEAFAYQQAEVQRIQDRKHELEQKLVDARSRANTLEQTRQQALRRARERKARQAARSGSPPTGSSASSSSGGSCSGGSVSGYPNGQIPESALCSLPEAGHMLRADAAAAFIRMNAAYAAHFGSSICVTDSYRSLAVQRALYVEKPTLAAYPGTSNHGWGLAVDLCGGVQYASSAQHAWMEANAPRFGWYHPAWAEIDGSKPEPWHWEYGHIS
ncbi:MAG: D-alanyl-D-alanine carboxypeptidase family protein [Streptosporangiaceae bacterium]